ncbi:hypothetical protein M2347_000645 [Chryseobacterium sp. H1D6B]|uniref:transposase n=1 Tax=Chryseobacterium sp. H1D6B TaxID=2940588 RepID=UPI0015CE2BAB|nr:transposase [Chryseobacterium sp. H1D6B]MDH6250918.1 hypothetical protein [Chryseobacterium sp. H1D6B]
MKHDFKEIQIGEMIKTRVGECDIPISRICNFLKCTEKEVEEMYTKSSIDTELILRWSKLLEYDFFRVYSQHLILYSPASARDSDSNAKEETQLPQFRKNIYTKEVIEFILELINSNEKTKYQIIEQYKIPKTTLYKWIAKYKRDF